MNLEMARFSLISKGKTCLVPGWWEDEKCTLFNTLAFVFAQNYLVKGASLALTPYRDDFQYTYPEKINDFDFTRGIDGQSPNCPFSAHIRKVVPRNLAPLVQKEYLEASTIIRAGISYGPKVRIWFVCLCIHSQIIRRSRERSGTRGSRLRMKSNNTRVIADCFMCATSLPSTTGSSDRLCNLQTTTISRQQASILRSTVSHVPCCFKICKCSRKLYVTGQDPLLGGPPDFIEGSADIQGQGTIKALITNQNTRKTYEVTGFAKAIHQAGENHIFSSLTELSNK